VSDVGHLNGGPTNYRFTTFQFSDDLHLQRGAHSMRFGVSVQRGFHDNAPGLDQAAYRFADLRAFLEARPNRFQAATLDSHEDRARYRQWLVGSYFQDDVRVGERLTLNLGLRWDFVSIPRETKGREGSILDWRTDTAITIGPAIRENPSVTNFAPRVGFAWTPWGERRPVIRGGAGVYYQPILARLYVQSARGAFLRNAQIANPPFPRPGLENVVDAAVEYRTWDPAPSTPKNYQYNLTVEQQLFADVVGTLSYAGSQGRDWIRQVTPNTTVPQVLADGTLFYPGGPRINPAFGNVRMMVTDAAASYNSIQLQVRRRGARIAWQTSYTFSNTMSEATTWSSGHAQNTPPVSLVADDPGRDRSLAPYHVRHALALNGTYRFPGDSLTGLAAALAGGWEISGMFTAYAGTPLTIGLGFNRSRDGNEDAPDRPDLVPGASNNPVLGGADRWYDPTAFALPPAGFHGDLGRNTVIGPGLAVLDMALVKTFHLRPGQTLAFRTEFFNLLNRANFGMPVRIPLTTAGVPAANAGVIQSINTTARQVQLGLRYTF
jgi:hypothetical protein